MIHQPITRETAQQEANRLLEADRARRAAALPQTVAQAFAEIGRAEREGQAAARRRRVDAEQIVEAGQEAQLLAAQRLGFADASGHPTRLHLILKRDPHAAYTCDPDEREAVAIVRADVARVAVITGALKLDSKQMKIGAGDREALETEAATLMLGVEWQATKAGCSVDRLIALVETSNAMRATRR